MDGVHAELVANRVQIARMEQTIAGLASAVTASVSGGAAPGPSGAAEGGAAIGALMPVVGLGSEGSEGQEKAQEGTASAWLKKAGWDKLSSEQKAGAVAAVSAAAGALVGAFLVSYMQS